jgi:hypothetical protein
MRSALIVAALTVLIGLAPTLRSSAALEGPAALPNDEVQKAALYEDDPSNDLGKRFAGSVVWRTEMMSSGPGQPPELAVRADVEVPERKLIMVWSLRRNTDKKLPATHTVEIMFKLPADFPSGGISNVPGILMKQAEPMRGEPLAGTSVKVLKDYWFIALSNAVPDKERNLQLLNERGWIDIPVVYADNRRAVLAIEKGTAGERAFAEAFNAWQLQDRATGDPTSTGAPAALPSNEMPTAALYEEDPSDDKGKRFAGSVTWRTEMVSPGPGQPPELVIRADVEVPERKLAMTWSLRRNTDKNLSASHIVEITFKPSPDLPSGSISNVPGMLMKLKEITKGVPLAGRAVKVVDGSFLIRLSAVEADTQRNLEMLKEREWLDIPVVYADNRRAVLAIEKGTPGERAFAEAFKAWQ